MQNARGRWLCLAALGLYACLALLRLNAYDLQSDEGRFGLSGLNISSDYHQLATVSEDPLGGPGTKPYMYPILLAGSMFVMGQNEFAVRFVNVLLVLLTSMLVYALAHQLTKDPLASALSFGLFLLNPGSLVYARTAMPEPSVVFWGCAALYACMKFYERNSLFWAALCGMALGLAFLSKLWLVLPFGLACFVLFVLQLVQRKSIRAIAIPLAAFTVFVCVAFSHLLLVRLLVPDEFSYWMRMYFGTALSDRAAGAGFDPAIWFRPWWFYLAAFFKATFFGLPFLLLGFRRVWPHRAPEAAGVLGSLLLMLPILSLFTVKEAAYLFPIFPAIVILMALGLSAFFSETRTNDLALCALISMLLAGWFYTKAVFGARELIMMETLYLLYGAAGLSAGRYKIVFRGVTAAALSAAMVFTSVVAIRRDMNHRTYYREIAQFFKKALETYTPQQVVFVSPEYPAFEFYTFRSGQYWRTYLFHADFATFERRLSSRQVVFYVADPTGTVYGGAPSPEEWRVLQSETLDVTQDVEKSIGHKISLRVFVPPNTLIGRAR